jgi:hypothetical protein
MTVILLDFLPILAASDSEGGEAILAAAAACLLAGPIFFIWKYLYYRNADKRHSHEHETKALIENVVAEDNFIQQRKRLRNSEMDGRNDKRVDGALLNGGIGSIGGVISKLTKKL